MAKMNPDKLGELLSAYADGEVTADEAALVEQLCQQDEGSRQLLEAIQQTKSLVGALPRHAAPPTLAEDVVRCAERDALLDNRNAAPSARRQVRSPWRTLLSTAAVLALTAAGLYWVIYATQDAPSTLVTDAFHPNERHNPKATQAPNEASPPSAAGKKDKTDSAKKRRGRGARSRDLDREEDYEPEPPTPRVPEGFAMPMKVPVLRDADDKTATDAIARDPGADTKKGIGMGMAALSARPFRNETLRVRITASTEEARKTLHDKMATLLADHGVAAVSANDEAAEPRTRSFYYTGVPGANFAEDSGDRQVLLHVPASVAHDVVTRLAKGAGDDVQATMAVGPVEFEGWGYADRLLASMATTDPSEAEAQAATVGNVQDRANDASAVAMSEPPPAGSASTVLVEELLQAMGVGPEVMQPANPAGPRPHERPDVPAAARANKPGDSQKTGEDSASTGVTANRPADLMDNRDEKEAEDTGNDVASAAPLAVVSPEDDADQFCGPPAEAAPRPAEDGQAHSLVARRLAELTGGKALSKQRPTSEKPSGKQTPAPEAATRTQAPPETYLTIVIEWGVAPQTKPAKAVVPAKPAESKEPVSTPSKAPTEERQPARQRPDTPAGKSQSSRRSVIDTHAASSRV